jgi:predicted  nucleic acid-binding Zn-ribbon protein
MKLQQSENELKQKVEYAKNEAKDISNELQQYRLRAQNQLQLKEKMIEKLQSGNVQVENSQDSSTLQIEFDQLKDQKEHLNSELKLLTQRLDESKSFIEKMEHKHRMMQSESEDRLASLDNIINQLNFKIAHHEEEFKLQKREIDQVRDEMLKQKTQLTTKLHEKLVGKFS